MGALKKLREKYSVIRFLVNAQKTPWYPALFAALCVIAGTHDYTVYIPILWVLAVFVIFSALFTDDNKVFLTPLLMIFFALGRDTDALSFSASNGDMLSFMDEKAFPQVILLCVICVGAFVIRLIADGSIAAAFKKRRRFTWGIIAMDIAFLANGLFSSGYSVANLGIGAFLAMGFTVVYFLVSGMLETSDDPITYGCFAMMGTAYVALIQIMTVAIGLMAEGKFIIEYSGQVMVNRVLLTLGWGVPTVISAVFVLGIPAAMYLAKNRQACWFSYISAVLFVAGTVIINTRSAMIVSIVAFLICSVICCVTGKNRKPIRIFTAILVLLTAAGVLYVNFKVISLSDLTPKLLDLLRLDGVFDSGRGSLWENGISDFLSSPVFGTGFNDGGYSDELRRNNFFSNMYHCILIQLPGAMGIIGCAAFLIHLIEGILLLFRRFSADKLLLFLIPLMILGMSLVDNFFFYLHFQIFYGAFIALAEKSDNALLQNSTKKVLV